MASRKHNEDDKRMSDDCLSSTISSSTLEIVLDDRSLSNSGDEDSNDQARQSTAGTTGNDGSPYRRKKQIPLRDPKSHRLIEKRRRDRMNACLNELLQLIPHEVPESQRRIEKTEIIEMAIKHMRSLISSLEKKPKNTDSNIDSYRTGYRNGLSDLFEYLEEYPDSEQFLIDLTQHFKTKEIDLKSLTVMPDRKRPKYLTISDKRTQSSHKEQTTKSNKDDDKICVISAVEEYKQSELQSSNIEQQSSIQQSDSNVKVPIFVLHPSGTHYIPMCIDSSVVSNAFKKKNSRSTTDQAQCHPVSIPVNFNPITTFSDSYELDIQNINVIGTRHQTSVRPN